MSDKLVVSGSAVIEARIKKDVIDKVSYLTNFFKKLNNLLTGQRKELHHAVHSISSSNPEDQSKLNERLATISKSVHEGLDSQIKENYNVLLALDEIESLLEQEDNKETPKSKKESELRKLKKNAQDFKALYASMDSAAKRLSSAIQNGAVAVSRGQQPDLQAFNAAFTDANAVFDEAIRIYASSGNAEWKNLAKVLQDRKQAIQPLSTQFNSLISEWSGKVTEQNQQPFLQAKNALLLLVEDHVSLN